MEIKRVGSQPSGKGPADWFTGTVRIDPLFQAPDPAFVAYVRTTERIELDAAGGRAAEQGTWVGTTRGQPDTRGSYLATWRKVTGQWVIENELFVTLT